MMDRFNKQLFVNEIMNDISMDIIKDLDKIPENWDGKELRHFILSKAKDHLDADRFLNKKSYRYKKYREFMRGNDL